MPDEWGHRLDRESLGGEPYGRKRETVKNMIFELGRGYRQETPSLPDCYTAFFSGEDLNPCQTQSLTEV